MTGNTSRERKVFSLIAFTLPVFVLAGCSMQQSPQGCQFNAPYASTVENVNLCGVEGDPTREGNTVTTKTDADVSALPQ